MKKIMIFAIIMAMCCGGIPQKVNAQCKDTLVIVVDQNNGSGKPSNVPAPKPYNPHKNTGSNNKQTGISGNKVVTPSTPSNVINNNITITINKDSEASIGDSIYNPATSPGITPPLLKGQPSERYIDIPPIRGEVIGTPWYNQWWGITIIILLSVIVLAFALIWLIRYARRP